MTDKEMNKLADIIVDKLLTTYIREQSKWYTTDTFEAFMNQSVKPKTSSEEQLLGELASLMTQLNLHQEKEEYEKCAELKKKIDELRKRIKDL